MRSHIPLYLTGQSETSDWIPLDCWLLAQAKVAAAYGSATLPFPAR
jgi:hypothetical protein